MNSSRVVAVVCYTVGQVGVLGWAVWYLWLGTGHAPPLVPLVGPLLDPWPWVVDLGLLALFAVQHSVMARLWWKQAEQRVVPPHLQRVVYVGVSGTVVALLALLWQPVGEAMLWHGPLWIIALPLLSFLVTMHINSQDQGRFFGLTQAWEPGRELPLEEFRAGGLYRWVRHPLMACMLVFLWAQPVMTLTHAVQAAGITLYIAVALVFEERDLRKRFPQYEAYRRRVPGLVPWRRPLPEGWTPAPGE